ncbi:Sterol 3-beta-glucosyltransferase [Apophysomyces ossiformis]|uniref:Sterol 3-beta-glucosyltransferase n=1 Tax=Apophysomyces ossiformis TaxID=679940 RepID=A0A8H7BDK2_9FUNG|nr:Sterol 3-beta-glucosyltransferase [Apophysomyces ossiformis]
MPTLFKQYIRFVDLGSSIDAIFPHHAWSDVSSTDDLANRQSNEVSGDRPRYMRELLAEAAGASFHDDMSMPAAEEEQNMQSPREAESSLKEHSLAEKVQTIFNFEKAESLRGGGNILMLNALHKAVFKAKTNGASFKLSLPFESILDMEQTGELEFQRFLKIRAVGIDDNFVVDEYYFAYFPDIKSTFAKLSEAWERSQHASNEMKDSMISFTNCPPPNIATTSPDASTMISPSLSISDLYDADAQPITIPAIGSGHRAKHSKQSASVTSIVANALAVPGAIKELLYPPSVNAKGKATETVSNKRFMHEQEFVTDHASEIFEDTSSSEDDRSVVDWLDEKRKSGMKLVYGLLGGSAGNINQDQDDEDDDIHSREERLQGQHANSGDINERTRSKFREYFVLPESEKLYAGT